MTTISIDLPEETAMAARDAGLLTPDAMRRLLTREVARHQAAVALLSLADRVAAAGVAEISMQEIDAEVKAVRHERQRASGC